jgi:hypothetical protein
MSKSDSTPADKGATPGTGMTPDPQLQIILAKLELIQSDINAMDNDIAEFKLALFKRVWIVAIVSICITVLLMRFLLWT